MESPHPADDGPVLVDAVAHGDANALARLYDRHSGLAYSLCLLILGNAADAEEAVADTFLQVWRTARSFDAGRGSAVAWIVTIARSRALDGARRRARATRHVDAMLDPETKTVQRREGSASLRVLPDVDQVDAKRLAVWALDQLPIQQRQAIELAYLHGFTHAEISSRLGEPVGTVKTRIRDGMKKLRATLSPSSETIGR